MEHEIDLELFKTLTENELRDLGIHAFGVRRRMLLTIAGKIPNFHFSFLPFKSNFVFWLWQS